MYIYIYIYIHTHIYWVNPRSGFTLREVMIRVTVGLTLTLPIDPLCPFLF